MVYIIICIETFQYLRVYSCKHFLFSMGNILWANRGLSCWIDPCPQDLLHKQLMNSLSKSYEKEFCSQCLHYLIRSYFCTCHDSWAVMACTKLWPDLIRIFHIKIRYIFSIKFGLWAHGFFAKWANVPGLLSVQLWDAPGQHKRHGNGFIQDELFGEQIRTLTFSFDTKCSKTNKQKQLCHHMIAALTYAKFSFDCVLSSK